MTHLPGSWFELKLSNQAQTSSLYLFPSKILLSRISLDPDAESTFSYPVIVPPAMALPVCLGLHACGNTFTRSRWPINILMPLQHGPLGRYPLFTPTPPGFFYRQKGVLIRSMQARVCCETSPSTMCDVCLCVTRLCHCVPAGQQIPPDHSSEWDLIPLGLFISLPPFSAGAGGECGPGTLTDQTIGAPPLMPTNHTLPQPQTLPPNELPVTAESSHLPQFHAVQNTAQTAFVLRPKTLARSKYTPPCVAGTPHPLCVPLSSCLTCVCRPTGCLWSPACLPPVKGIPHIARPVERTPCPPPNWPALSVSVPRRGSHLPLD